ncbi:hypothetical protein HJC10_02980 [Corallococcus exiguus]|nr:hypothetical protein [Corallococcus exiguus]
MTETLEVVPREREEGAAVLLRSWQLTRALLQELSPRDLRTGRWFTQLLSIYLRHYDTHRLHAVAAAKGMGADTTRPSSGRPARRPSSPARGVARSPPASPRPRWTRASPG